MTGLKNPPLVITVWHHKAYPLASLVIPNADLLDGFFYLTFTLMMDSYITKLFYNLKYILLIK